MQVPGARFQVSGSKHRCQVPGVRFQGLVGAKCQVLKLAPETCAPDTWHLAPETCAPDTWNLTSGPCAPSS